MNKEEFMEAIKMSPRTNQYEYYSNILDFLKDPHKRIMIARGGMALGKTIATSLAIKNILVDYDKVFVATPYSKIKGNWCNEMNKLGLSKQITEWLSKKDCIPKEYHKDVNDCKDDCEHRIHLEKREDGYTWYSPICESLLNQITFPLYASKWHEDKGYDSCLFSPIRMGLRDRDIAIGDFMPVLNQKIMNNVVFPERGSLASKHKSLLVIDEGHRLPDRAESFFNKSLNLSYVLNKLKSMEEQSKLYSCEFYQALHLGVEGLKRVEKYLKKKISKADKDEVMAGQIRYTIHNFIVDFESNSQVTFYQFLQSLKQAKDLLSKEEYETEDDPYLKRLYSFLNSWLEKIEDDNYKQYFQYSQIGEGNIIIEIICNNIEERIKALLNSWKKVVIISGTIHKEFINEIGFKENEVFNPEQLNAFSIKEDVLIYSKPYQYGDFWNKNLYKTMEQDKETIRTILENVNGRTLIFLVNKEISRKFEEIIPKRRLFNLCFKKDDEYKKAIESFSNSQDGVALLNIKGRVEGTNFIDEEGQTIENLIIYGYPNPIPNWKHLDSLNSLISKYKDKTLANAHLSYIPTGNIIHQACCRAKRSASDKPLILLMGDMYQPIRNEYKFLPNDLHGKQCENKIELLNKIEVSNGRREN
jgi:Rad3-related DNA helicase